MDIQRIESYMKRVEQSETETFQPVGNKFKWDWILVRIYRDS